MKSQPSHHVLYEFTTCIFLKNTSRSHGLCPSLGTYCRATMAIKRNGKCELRTRCDALQILWKQCRTHLAFLIAVISDDVQRPEFSCFKIKLRMHHQCSRQIRGLALVIWRQSQSAQRRLQDLQGVVVRDQYYGHPAKRPRTFLKVCISLLVQYPSLELNKYQILNFDRRLPPYGTWGFKNRFNKHSHLFFNHIPKLVDISSIGLERHL